MISKAVFKNTIKELIRTRWVITIGIVAVAIIVISALANFIIDGVFMAFSFIITIFSMLFTVDIIDSEISDGKVLTVLTKPVSYMQFFLGKALGVILISSIIIVLMTLSALIVLYAKHSVELGFTVWKTWILLPIFGILANVLWVLICSTLSTFLKGHSNITAIILFSFLFGALTLIPNETLKDVTKFVDDYILPNPTACLELLRRPSQHFPFSKLFHSLFYVVFLSVIGPLILSRRELGKK